MSLLLCMCAWSLSQDNARATVEDPPENVQARSWVLKFHLVPMSPNTAASFRSPFMGAEIGHEKCKHDRKIDSP